ncbi:hypothetical protein ACFSTC_37420 [Nonomuraea ferruginea]
MVEKGFLDEDGGMLFIGPEAEKHFGRRHFIELTASFTAPPQFTVLSGRQEIGRTDPSVLTEERAGPHLLLLGGRSWRVTFIDWARRRAFAEPADGGGVAKWTSGGIAGLSYALTQAMREVLLGADPPVSLTRRAQARLAEWRQEEAPGLVHPGGTLITRAGDDVRWWTWARLSRQRDARRHAALDRRPGSASDRFLCTAARGPDAYGLAGGPQQRR